MGTKHRVAALQAEPVWMDLEGTTAKTIRLIEQAAKGKAELVGFPETWLPSYPVFLWSYPVYQQAPFVQRYYANSPTVNDEPIRRIREAARRNRISVVLGFSEKAGGSLYMGQLLIGPDGEVLLHRRKLKATHAERTLFGESDGSGIKVVDSPVGRLGALNCYEHIQPLTKYAMYAQNEQVHVASWPCLSIMGNQPMLSPETLAAATKIYALEGSAFVVLSNQIMTREGARAFATSEGEPTPLFTGGGGVAGVYGPDSGLLTKPLPPGEEGMVFADIDLAAIDLAKNVVDPAGHYARPDVTRLVFNPRPLRPVTVMEDLSAAEFDAEAGDAEPLPAVTRKARRSPSAKARKPRLVRPRAQRGSR